MTRSRPAPRALAAGAAAHPADRAGGPDRHRGRDSPWSTPTGAAARSRSPFPTTPPGDGARSATARSRRTPSARTSTTTCSPRSRAAQQQILLRDLHLEGRRDRRAVQDRAGRRRPTAASRSTCIYDGFANLVVSPPFKRFPPEREGAALPRLHRRAALLGPAPLRPRPPQDPGGRRRGRLRGRLQHRHRLRDRVARHPRADHRRRACGTSSAPSRTSGTSTAAGGSGTASGRCCWRPPPSGSRGSGSTATSRGCGCSRSAAMYLEAINRATPQRLDDPRLLHPRPGLRRRAARTPPRRGVDVRLLMPLKSNHIVADWISRGYFCQLLDAGVRILRFQRRDGARQDRHHRRQLVDRRHRQHRPALACRATTRSTSRSSTRAWPRIDGGDLPRSTSRTASSSPAASGRPATCTASSPSASSSRCGRCSSSAGRAGGSAAPSAGRAAGGGARPAGPAAAARPRCGR